MTLQQRITLVVQAIAADIKNLMRATTLTTIEVNLGPSARKSGFFTITGLSGLTVGKQVIVTQALAPYTGKGARADEGEMDALTLKAFVADANTIKVAWESSTRVRGNFKFNYFIQN